MSFNQNLSDENKKIIVGILKNNIPEKEKAQQVIDMFPEEFKKYLDFFDYNDYCDTEYEERGKKYNFIPIFKFFAGHIENKTISTFLINLNCNVISIVKELKHSIYKDS